VITNEINAAIKSHNQWKLKILTAIATGKSEFTVEKVKNDDQCQFGKWLHKQITPKDQKSPFYKQAIDLHAKFHKQAAKALELALAGKKEAANQAVSSESEYNNLSFQLTKTLMRWAWEIK